MYARSVSLVLTLGTGLAFPRFSVVHHDFFETTRYSYYSTQTKFLQVQSGLDYANTIQRQKKGQKLESSTEDVYNILIAEDKARVKQSQQREVSSKKHLTMLLFIMPCMLKASTSMRLKVEE